MILLLISFILTTLTAFLAFLGGQIDFQQKAKASTMQTKILMMQDLCEHHQNCGPMQLYLEQQLSPPATH